MNIPKLSIIIPCYNEEKTVGTIIRRVLAVPFPGWTTEVIVVNDGSTDSTASVLEKFASCIRVIHLLRNSGKGSAVKAGIEAATGDFAVIQDADLECQPEEIPRLLEPFRDSSSRAKIAVMGSRELHIKNSKSLSLSRLGGLSITRLINILYGSSLTDVLMGYKLFPRAAFDYFNPGGFESEVLFIAQLLKESYRIAEVPVLYHPRKGGVGKKMKYRHGFYTIMRLLIFRVTGR